jgi:CPA1 family monovalent cation:H+ antiporter
MQEGELLALVVASLAVTAVCRRRGWPAPLVLVAVGLAVSIIPGFPELEINGDLVLGLVLPPLLYSAALRCSYTGFRDSIATISALGVGLVAITTVAVGAAAYLLVSDMPLAVALVLGAVVAPPDAVAATSIGRRLGLPRRIVMVLTGESLINDATALTLYKLALAAALGISSGVLGGVGLFVWTTVGGIAVGLVFGLLVSRLRTRLHDPTLETVMGLLVPFIAYLVGEEIGASGVLAVVAAGLFIGRRGPTMGYATRLQEEPVWAALDTLLEAAVFGLIGIQVRFVVANVVDSTYALDRVLVLGLIVLVVVIAVRFATVFALGGVIRFARRRGLAMRQPPPEVRYMTVVSWAGMRGVVTLAVASAIPLTLDDGSPFPDRAVVQLVSFIVVIGTLLVQGLTLPALIRRLHAQDPREQAEDIASEEHLYDVTTRAALAHLDTARETWPQEHQPVLDRIATVVRAQGRAAIDGVRAQREEMVEVEADAGAARSLPYEIDRIWAAMLGAQREVLLAARDEGDVPDEVMREVLHWVDLEEAAFAPRGHLEERPSSRASAAIVQARGDEQGGAGRAM